MGKWVGAFFIFLFFLAFSNPHAADIVQIPYSRSKSYGYLAPNEKYPQKAKKIIEEAPDGIYVSVGTDRGFNYASFSDKVSHLLLTDIDDLATRFNHINIALLQICKDRKDYLNLRLHADFQEWQRAAFQSPYLSKDLREVILDRKYFNFWVNKVRSHKFDDIHDPPSPGGAFYGANYLYVDQQFERILKLAREDKIQAVQLNYKDSEVVKLLVDQLHEKGISLGVLDLSNAWIPHYMKYHLAEVLLAFEKISKPESVFFITNYARAYETPVWNYLGFSYKTMKEYGFQDFTKILNENLLVVRNQKVVNLTYQTKVCLEQVLGELKSGNTKGF